MTAARPRVRDRAIVAASAVVLTAVGLGIEFLAVYAAGMRCDESCDASDGWRHDPDAWQWQFQLVPATLGLLLIASVIVLGALGRLRAAAYASMASAATYVGWFAFMAF